MKPSPQVASNPLLISILYWEAFSQNLERPQAVLHWQAVWRELAYFQRRNLRFAMVSQDTF